MRRADPLLPRRQALAMLTAGAVSIPLGSWAQAPQVARTAVRDVLSVEEGRLDFLHAKLAFDAVVNPAADGDAVIRAVEGLTAAAQRMVGTGADFSHKLAAVRAVIYQAGPWNGQRPFAYDQADPYGRNIQNKLLATYIATRRGNCVSMPVLFLIIADRLGVPVTLSTAPLHVFVRHVDSGGRAVNLEATSGGHTTRDVWYREHLPMTDEAIVNGIYMRTISPRESVALMATTVAEYLYGAGRYDEAIAVGSVILEHSPRDAQTMVLQASCYGRLLHEEFERYPSPQLIPASLLPRYHLLGSMNERLFAQAEALGWRPAEQ